MATKVKNVNQLICGNCLDIMATFPDKSIDCIIADLPYGITRAKWDKILPLDKLWTEYKRLAKPDCPIVLFASQPFTSRLISSNLDMFKYCQYWEKERGTGYLNSKIQPLRVIEEICVFYNKAKYNPDMTLLDKPYKHKLPTIQSATVNPVKSCNNQDEYKEYTHSCPKNILRYSRDKTRIHATQKPLKLMEYLVKSYSNERDVILDNTMGSGTTCLAAKNLNRSYIGIEQDESMYARVIERVSHHQYQEVTRP